MKQNSCPISKQSDLSLDLSLIERTLGDAEFLKIAKNLPLESLYAFSQTNRRFCAIASTVARDLISRHFPYLKTQEAFKNNPLLLFKNEYLLRKEQAKYCDINFNELLDYLSGNLSILEDKNDTQKQAFLAFSFLLGNDSSFAQLNNLGKEILLRLAILEGHTSLVYSLINLLSPDTDEQSKKIFILLLKFYKNEWFNSIFWNQITKVSVFLLEQFKEILTTTDIETTSHFAGSTGNLPLINLLLEQCEDSVEDIICSALCPSAEKGHLDVFKILLSKYKIIRPTLDKYSLVPFMLFDSAVKSGNTEIIKTFLEQYKNHIKKHIPKENIECGLYSSLDRNNDPDMVNVFLDNCMDKTSLEDIGRTLVKAARFGRAEIIEIMLMRYKDKISSRHKGLALIYASRNDMRQGVELILSHCKDEISTLDKYGASNTYSTHCKDLVLSHMSNWELLITFYWGTLAQRVFEASRRLLEMNEPQINMSSPNDVLAEPQNELPEASQNLLFDYKQKQVNEQGEMNDAKNNLENEPSILRMS